MRFDQNVLVSSYTWVLAFVAVKLLSFQIRKWLQKHFVELLAKADFASRVCTEMAKHERRRYKFQVPNAGDKNQDIQLGNCRLNCVFSLF